MSIRILILMMFSFLGNAQEVSKLLEATLTDTTDTPVHSISIVIEKQGEVLVSEAVGKRQKNGDAVEITDAFRIASSTKTFIATIILQMEEEGKLTLSNDMYSYLKDVEYLKLDDFHVYNDVAFAKTITIEQVLSHRSGLADIFTDQQEAFFERVMQNPQRKYQPNDVVDLYFEYGLHKKTKCTPGEGWHYSDMNYVLLGLLIEKLDQQSLSQSIRERIINPLKLKDTYFEFYEKPETNTPRMHQYIGAIDFKNVNTSFDWSGGGLVSTHQDLVTFIKGLFEGKLISKQSLQKMITVYPNTQDHLPYGLGVYQSVYKGDTFYGHYGFYGTYIGYCPDKKTVLSYCITQATPTFNVYELINSVIETIE